MIVDIYFLNSGYGIVYADKPNKTIYRYFGIANKKLITKNIVIRIISQKTFKWAKQPAVPIDYIRAVGRFMGTVEL